MRLIKLSTDIFVDENDLNDYFDNRLAEQKYKFHFGDQISSNGIHPDEVVLFSYQNELRYIAKAKTCRMDSTGPGESDYPPHYIVIKRPIRKASGSLLKLEHELRVKAGFKTLLKGQGWTIIPDSKQAEGVIESFSVVGVPKHSAADVLDGMTAKKRYFTQYWANDTWKNNAYQEGELLDYTAGNLFVKSNVNEGEAVYVVTVLKGRLYLLGRLTVARIYSLREWKQFRDEENIWPAKDHVWAATATPMRFKRQVPPAITKQLRFVNSANNAVPLRFSKSGHIHQQTLRRIRILTPASALLLDNLLRADKAITIDLPGRPSRLGGANEYVQGTLLSDINAINSDSKIRNTVKKLLCDARLGQGKFRSEVSKLWNGRCAVTGSSTSAVLEASHIRKWSDSNNAERLDPHNGLLLTANLHKLFDKGLIAFDDSGKMLVSPTLPPSEQKLFGVIRQSLSKKPSSETAKYLAYHQTKFIA